MAFGPYLFLAILEGLVQASVLTITAVGLSLVFGVMRVVNVAHGEFFMLGAVFAWSAFAGHLQSFGGIAIKLGVTPGMAVGGILFAVFLAFIGGIFPAVKAARQPIATALRAT